MGRNEALLSRCASVQMERLQDSLKIARRVVHIIVETNWIILNIGLSLLKLLLFGGGGESQTETIQEVEFWFTRLVLLVADSLKELANLVFRVVFDSGGFGSAMKVIIEALCYIVNAMMVVWNNTGCWIFKNVAVPIVRFLIDILRPVISFFIPGAYGIISLLEQMVSFLGSMDCNMQFNCTYPGTPTPSRPIGATPVATRCWTDYTPGVDDSDSLSCTRSDTCRASTLEYGVTATDFGGISDADGNKEVVCETCPLQPGGATNQYGCDLYTRQCTCNRPKRQQTYCTSNAECALIQDEEDPPYCALVGDYTTGYSYGSLPCQACLSSQPVCHTLDPESTFGTCTCLSTAPTLLTCPSSEVGRPVSLLSADSLCLTSLSPSSWYNAEAFYGWETLATTPCAVVPPGNAYCYRVDSYGPLVVGLRTNLQFLPRNPAAAARRRLLGSEQEGEEPGNGTASEWWDACPTGAVSHRQDELVHKTLLFQPESCARAFYHHHHHHDGPSSPDRVAGERVLFGGEGAGQKEEQGWGCTGWDRVAEPCSSLAREVLLRGALCRWQAQREGGPEGWLQMGELDLRKLDSCVHWRQAGNDSFRALNLTTPVPDEDNRYLMSLEDFASVVAARKGFLLELYRSSGLVAFLLNKVGWLRDTLHKLASSVAGAHLLHLQSAQVRPPNGSNGTASASSGGSNASEPGPSAGSLQEIASMVEQQWDRSGLEGVLPFAEPGGSARRNRAQAESAALSTEAPAATRGGQRRALLAAEDVKIYSSLTAGTDALSNIPLTGTLADTWLEGPFAWPPKFQYWKQKGGAEQQPSCAFGSEVGEILLQSSAVLDKYYKDVMRGKVLQKPPWDFTAPAIKFYRGPPKDEGSGAPMAGSIRAQLEQQRLEGGGATSQWDWVREIYIFVGDELLGRFLGINPLGIQAFMTSGAGLDVEADGYTAGSLVKELLVCDFEAVIMCSKHKRNVVISFILAYSMYWVLTTLMSAVGFGGLNFFVLLLVAPVAWWLAYGISPMCGVMVPTCFLGDIVDTIQVRLLSLVVCAVLVAVARGPALVPLPTRVEGEEARPAPRLHCLPPVLPQHHAVVGEGGKQGLVGQPLGVAGHCAGLAHGGREVPVVHEADPAEGACAVGGAALLLLARGVCGGRTLSLRLCSRASSSLPCVRVLVWDGRLHSHDVYPALAQPAQ